MVKKNNPNYEWNLELLFKNELDPKIEKNLKLAHKKSYEFINKWKERTDYLKSPKILKEALEDYENWSLNYGTDGDVGYFLWLKMSLDQNNTELKARINKLVESTQKIENDIQFFLIRLSKIPKDSQSKFLKAKELKPYHHFLDKLFEEAKHLLSEEEEKIMNLKSKVSSYNWVQMTSEFLAKEEREVLNSEGEKETLSQSEIMGLIDHKDKNIRDTAAAALNDILAKWVGVGEHEINSIFENKRINDELRRYTRPDESRHKSDDIDTEVVDALISAVSNRFETARRFYNLKAKLLGVKKLQYHERNLEYGDTTKEYSFEDSNILIREVFEALHPKFAEILDSFVLERRIDVYPKKGKRSGAFCTEASPRLPIYILLNHTNQLDDVRTFAHEMGHGIHFTLMKNQNIYNYGAPMATAEVASTFMEDFVTQRLLHEADDDLRLSLMITKLNNEVSTIHRQVGIYNFETELHKTFREKGYLSKDEIGSVFQNNMKAYMGNSVEYSPGSENWWLYISHIRSFFYVYSYASGLLISKSLQRMVQQEPASINKVIEFFEAGSSESPKNIFKKLGVDITDKTFWNKGLDEIDELLKECELLAKKLGKI